MQTMMHPLNTLNCTIVHVSNFGEIMTGEKLETLFKKYGPIDSCKIMQHDDVSARFGYVAFEDSDDADNAVIEMNGQKMEDGRRINVRRTCKKNPAEQTKMNSRPESSERTWSFNPRIIPSGIQALLKGRKIGVSVYVKRIDATIDSRRLREIFECYGTVLWSDVIMDPKAKEQWGLITFTSMEEARKAIKALDGRCIGTQVMRIALTHGKHGHRSATMYAKWEDQYPVMIPDDLLEENNDSTG